MDSDSEDMDISLFSEKFKQSQKRLKKKKTRIVADKLDETTSLHVNKKLKRKHSEDIFNETSGMGVENKIINKSADNEEIAHKHSKKQKRRHTIKNVVKDSDEDYHESEKNLNKAEISLRTGSEESELESTKEGSESLIIIDKLRQEKSSRTKKRPKDGPDKKVTKIRKLGKTRLDTENVKKHGPKFSETKMKLPTSNISVENAKTVHMQPADDSSESSSSEENVESKDIFNDGVGEDKTSKRQKIASKHEALSDDDDGNETNEEEDKYAAIKRELANIPLEDLVRIKEKLGLKVFRKIMHGGKYEDSKKQRVFKRENKNRPMEMSSKRPVPVLRHMDVPKQKIRRDPRFDDLSGEFKEEYFDRNYSFLQDMKAKEREVLKKDLKKSKNEEKKQKLQHLLNRMNQQEQFVRQKQRQKELEASLKQREKELIKEGKTPYFLKKAERRKLELAEKYKELQKSGKMDQYLSRKRKKNAQKEKKKLPGRHTKV